MHPSHKEVLQLIKQHSGKATKHTHQDGYLGSTHFRYAINLPTLRTISKAWMKDHRDMSAKEFQKLLTSLAEAESHTEKIMVGCLLDEATNDQRKFDPHVFDKWLDHLEGWAEVDSVCTGKYTRKEIQAQWKDWKKITISFSKSKNIHKRRASIVLFCAPLRKPGNDHLLETGLHNIQRLKHEKDVLITKAISWMLRSALPSYKKEISDFLSSNKDSLPKIAVRETMTKLRTGRKTKRPSE